MATSIMWFRRDLRLADNPALCDAAAAGDVLPVFVLDPRLMAAGGVRAARLLSSLAALREDMGNALVIRTGDPVDVLPALAREAGATTLHIAREITPYGRRRDAAVAGALSADGVHVEESGSPYAVTPGRVVTGSGEPYRVFTPFLRAWRAHGWRGPAERPDVNWRTGVAGDAVDLPPADRDAGEQAARAAWDTFRSNDLAAYDAARDRPDLDATSRMSVPLKYGEIHPRTLLADLADLPDNPALDRFEAELAWREFYADVLWTSPSSAWQDWRDGMATMAYNEAPDLLEAWHQGRTGYPFVDAGMRQLRSEGWMHNRLRMVTASFLVKDLHLWWPHGARFFFDRLVDGDLASNSHGWQWVAGTGTDAAPYFRIFNPVTQGLRFDPDGDFVRRWVPELRHLAGRSAHEPWRHDDGYRGGYVTRIVDHDVERREALTRWSTVRNAS